MSRKVSFLSCVVTLRGRRSQKTEFSYIRETCILLHRFKCGLNYDLPISTRFFFCFFCTANVGYCGGGSGKLFKVGILPEGKDNLRIVLRRIQNETILTDKRVLGAPKRARRRDERGIRRFAGEVRSPAPSISLLSPACSPEQRDGDARFLAFSFVPVTSAAAG